MNEFSLLTFASEKPKPQKKTLTVLDIKLRNGSILKITANVMPIITGSVQRRPFDTKYLKGIQLLRSRPFVLSQKSINAFLCV